MSYLSALTPRELWNLQQIIERGFVRADLNGWEDTANECSGVLVDLWFEGAHDPATCRNGDHYGQCSGATSLLLRNGDCGYGVVPEEWHHGVAGPPMTDAPADRCER